MKAKPAQNFTAARWILAVGLALLLGVIAVTTLSDRKGDGGERTKTSRAESSSQSGTSARATPPVVVADVPPWQVVSQGQQFPLPEGVVPASEINPPPPDPNAAPPPRPVEPPNPATHRP